MSLKLLIAACCLMAVVQARPQKPPTSTCSVACVSRTFWTGYQVGKVYTYEFDQTVELASELSRTQAGRLRLAGLAKVEVHSDCEMALTVEVKNARVGDIDDAESLTPRDPPAKVVEALRLPLRFAFENGQVAQLCPSSEETRASLNLKRGLLSQLQVSAEQRGQSHQLEERDVLGDCWTEYTPEGPNTLLKTKDLSKCKLNYQAYPLTGVKSFDDESIQSKLPITKGSLKCRIEIDSERDIVKETVCVEEQTQSVDQTSDSVEETVRTNARLTLKSETSGLANALQEVTRRTDLRHAHKTSGQCHSTSAWLEEDLFHAGNECVERSHGAKTSAEFKAQAKKTLEELCEETKATKGMSRSAPKKYADLIKYLRGVTEQEHLNELYTWVRDGYCTENPLLRTILRSAIPTVGTKQSVALILDQLSKSEVEGAHRDNWLINGIALMQHPTVDILPDLLNYVRKRRNDAMLSVTRDEPLALSAVVHKICQELPNCEAEPKVKAVIDYFSESLGPDCEQFSTDSDNAFVALLSVGNMGRVSGGAVALTRCAASQSLPNVYRVFALHSLRRFSNFSTEAQNKLVDLMTSSTHDSELRIAAYQALSRHGIHPTSRLYEAVRSLLDATDEDRHVQMFVYTHLKGLQGEAARQMAPLLKAAKLADQLDKLSRREYSNSLRAEYFSEALGTGAQAEMPIVFSAQSAIPRYVGLNLTVNSPSQGQSVNLMEIGVRMQGLEQLVEELYSRIAKKFSKDQSKPESARQVTATPEQNQSELSTEQSQGFGQSATEPRIDLLVRRYGAELSHTDISGGFLTSFPDVVSKSNYATLLKMMAPEAGREQIGVSAGTLAENTLAIPTITGLPILVKREMHYITNLRIDSKINALENAAETTLELKPAAAVLTSRTVAIDAIFERAGIQTSTSFLTSTGLRLSLKKSNAESLDRQFSFKVEPLVKKQQLADAKTEVNFFQHTAGKVHVEKPLAPQEGSVKREKCTEGFYKKYIGHKVCYKSDYLPSCRKSLRSFCQCPGSYQLFVEKDDDFGAYEVSFNLKNQANIQQLQVLVGDRKSTDRLLKLNLQYARQGDKINYKVELQNPIFPIILDSNFTKDSEGYQVYAEAKAGSVDYVASGSVQPHSEKGIWVNGEFYPKEKPAQKVKVSLEHKFDGFSALLLPLAATKLQVKMHTGNQIDLEYSLKQETYNFAWQMSSQYKTSKGDVTSMRYRVQYTNKLEDNTESSTILYDLEVQNPKGNNLAHSLHTKVIRRVDGDNKQTTASVNHKLQYGVEKKRSPVDCEVRINLKQTTEGELYKATGDGELTHFWSGEAFTAKLENVRIQIGEVEDRTDGFSKQYLHAIKYAIKVEETTADYEVELRHLQLNRWSLVKQAVELKAKAAYGAKSYSTHLKHALNGEKSQAWQIVKIQYNEEIKFHMTHKMQKAEATESIRSEFYLQDTDGNKVQAKWGVAWPEQGTMNCDLAVDVNGMKVLGCRHTLRYTSTERDHQVKYEMTLETPPSSYSLETNVRISRDSATDLVNFLNHQVRIITGRYRPVKSLLLLASFLRDLSVEHSSKLVGPTPAQRVIVENVVNMDNWANGVVLKHLLQMTVDSKDILNYGLIISRRSQNSESPVWTLKEGIKFEVNAMDKWLKSEVEGGLSVDRKSLKLASQDSWGWHDVKIDASTQKTTARRWETVLKLDGKIGKKSITSSLNVTCGWENENEHYLLANLATPESKLRVRLNRIQSPLKLTASLNLDGDFGLLPVKDAKATAEFSVEKGISFESKAEVEGTQIMTAKLHVAKNTFVADLKTAHPKLQEAGIKIVLDTDTPEAVKCNTIVKFIGLTKRLQIKKTGTATLSFSSPVYSLLFGLNGNMEFEGFESLISYKKLEYELLLQKKAGMEFQFVTSISSPDHTSSKQPMLYLTSTLSYWPFKAELKAKANNYKGWDVKYGAGVELDNKSAFVGVEYRDQEVSASYDIQDQPGNVKKANIRVKCSFCVDNGRDLIAGQANMTWPLRLSEFELGIDAQINSLMLQKFAARFVHRPNNKKILVAFLWDGRTQKMIDGSYTQTDIEGGIRGEALLQSDLRFFLGDKARAKVEASYQFGKDKELSFSMTLAKNDEDVIKGRLFWLSAPRSYETIPVSDVDRGFQVKGMGVDVYGVHVPKTDKSCQWRFAAHLPTLRRPITAWLELADNKVTAGKITALDREIILTSSPESGVQVTIKSGSDETKTLRVNWSGKFESLDSMRGKLEIEADGKTSVFEIKTQPQQIVINYGRSTAPNSLKIDYEIKDISSLWTMSADLRIRHETDVEKNSELTLLPGYRIPLPTTHYPFKLEINSQATLRSLNIKFESVSMRAKELFYKHDFPDFPWVFNIQSHLISAESNKKVWDALIKVHSSASDVQVMCQIGDSFTVSFRDTKLTVQLENVIDLKVQLPKFLISSDDSDKSELAIKLALPIIKMDQPISLKATLQGLTEGRQLKVKYSRGEDEEVIEWVLTARKFRVTPKFEINLETSLTSKNALLGKWQIRSVEASLETSIERLSESESYTITFKESVRINGDDLISKAVLLEGKNNALPHKGELTLAGYARCSLKFDFGKKDRLTKIRFSLDKLGEGRDKYSLKMDISPAKTGAWFPDFKVETECPHRQFVLGKESKQVSDESSVSVQLYLNKRQDHGVTIAYKKEAPTSDTPKYTVEIELPTRKLRAICQTESADKKFGIMTTFDWDADKSTERIVGLDARIDLSTDVFAILECKAPFLTKRVRIEGRLESKRDGIKLQLKHKSGDSEVLSIKAESSKQNQAETQIVGLSLETSGAVESKFSLTIQMRDEIENFYRSKIDGSLKIKINEMEKSIKFLYRPMREITVTCDHGAALSLKYTSDKLNLHQLVVFASDNEKNAARLKLACSFRRAGKFTAKLDIGRGSFKHDSDLRGPNFRPETVLLLAEVQRDGWEVSANAFVGLMTVGQKLNPFDAAAVPSHVVFFALATRNAEYNKMKFSVNWRTPSSGKMTSVINDLKQTVQNYLLMPALSVRIALDTRSVSSNLNTAWITEEIASLASNDFDKLTRYCERALNNNEFYLRHLARGAEAAGRIAKRFLAVAMEAADKLQGALGELRIVEKIAQVAEPVRKALINFYNWIPLQRMWEAAGKYAEQALNFGNEWYEYAAQNLSVYYVWVYNLATDPSGPRAVSLLCQQIAEYLNYVSPVFGNVKVAVSQTWSGARAIIGASFVGMKSLITDDLLPMAVNHLEDFKTIKEFYDNLMLELRIWYDTGATPAERTALTRSYQLWSYVYSEDTLKRIEGAKLILNGQLAEGFKKLCGQYSFSVWRPNCEDACQRGETFATVEGYFYRPSYSLSWPMASAPGVVLKRIGSKLMRKGLPESSLVSAVLDSTIGGFNPIDRLLAVRHRTAVISGDNHLITFDGLALTTERPCSYLVAREFPRGLFSIVQEYRKVEGRQTRDRLRVRFGSARVVIERDGTVKVDGKAERLPLKKTTEADKQVEARRSGDLLTVRFHGSLTNTLVLRCSSAADSCVISVHPLYHGSVYGLAGSNDGRRDNDIRKGDAKEHVKFWTAGQCATEGSASVSAPESESSSGSNDCFAWFRETNSPAARCFQSVDPRPYLALCQQQQRANRDPCKTVRQYKDRCSGENVKVDTPAKCVACRLDSEGEVTKPGLVTDKAALQKRIQVVFLVERSACGLDAAGASGSRLRSLATTIDRLRTTYPNLKSIQFGLAHFGDSESAEALTSIPMSDVTEDEDDEMITGRRFGSLAELTAALSRLPTSTGSDGESSVDVLRAIAALPAHFQWQPLAQKHLIVVSCRPCNAKSLSYGSLFAKAKRSVKDQVFVHTISKNAVRPAERITPDIVGYDSEFYHQSDWSSKWIDPLGARRLTSECSAELATETDSTAKGSVWRLEKFAAAAGDSTNQVAKLLVTKEIQRRLEKPDCRRCACPGDSGRWPQWQRQQQQPWCRVVKCDDDTN